MPLGGIEVFCTLDIIQGYWKMASHESAKDLSTMITIDGMLTPTLVPQGILDAIYFQVTTIAEYRLG